MQKERREGMQRVYDDVLDMLDKDVLAIFYTTFGIDVLEGIDLDALTRSIAWTVAELLADDSGNVHSSYVDVGEDDGTIDIEVQRSPMQCRVYPVAYHKRIQEYGLRVI